MTESTPQRGRPRSVSSQAAILDAAFALLEERGFSGLAFEAVAERAGVGKTTIYRWWKSRAELAVAAFFHATKDQLAFPQTGSARQDFKLQIIELATLLRGKRGLVLAALLGGARLDHDLARALGENWLAPRRKWGFERMMAAAAAREIRQGVDIPAALGILYGPLYTPLLFGDQVPTHEQVIAHLAIALPAIFNGD